MFEGNELRYNVRPGGEEEPLLERDEGKRNSWTISRPWRILLVLAVSSCLSLTILCFSKRYFSSDISDLFKADLLGGDLQFSQRCNGESCFTQSQIIVDKDRPGFPSFWNYADGGPLKVTYDGRSLMINGDRSFFLGGSMHPVRATKRTWEHALDEAVENGLNLVTIYVFWSAHQAFPGQPYDWSFSSSVGCADDSSCLGSSHCDCDWNLATSIREAANRGLFVHLRLGPYDCAEYNYGGIPEWLNIHSPNMTLRRPNLEWYDAMEGYVRETIRYITDEGLWAYQGGPILMGQIENELGGEMDESENIISLDKYGEVVQDPIQEFRKATLQDYADWCGELVDRLAPNVVWTMCNGLSAENTINTCNGISECPNWLEHHGGDGRVQVDRPAILTEFEGGFQVWGETPENPSDYFWGRTARDMTRVALKWFARGGTHLNYYMWYGGYNRGRMAGAGITNMYASDTIMCASGQRHQPKFNHVQRLHYLLADIAPLLLNAPTALDKGKKIEHLDQNGIWTVGKEQRMFEYKPNAADSRHVAFLENDAKEDVVVRIPNHDATSEGGDYQNITLSSSSCIVLVDGSVEFDSSFVHPEDQAFQRKISRSSDIPSLLDWSYWEEPIGADDQSRHMILSSIPVEQTRLNNDAMVSSDYAWYQTDLFLEETSCDAMIYIESQKSNGFLAFVDNGFVGSIEDYHKAEGNVTLEVDAGCISRGSHTLSLLSENFGYLNLIGRWGGSTKAKTKGITGDVILGTTGMNMSLVDGREWRSKAGLHGEGLSLQKRSPFDSHLRHVRSDTSTSPQWSSTLFHTPKYDPTSKALFLDIRAGRGHFWLNGKDLGRFWNITRGDSDQLSQQYYMLPDDYLYQDDSLNELVFFDAFGGTKRDISLVLSWIDASEDSEFLDEVDFPMACI